MENFGSYKNLKINLDTEKVLWVGLDCVDTTLNVFNISLMDDLSTLIHILSMKKNIKAVVFFSLKLNNFIAGADLSYFKQANDQDSVRKFVEKGQQVFSELENLSIPSIAVINGSCLGGGLEFALSCTYRIAIKDKSTRLGLPEVSLGILPGWGGTVRLLRLCGHLNGLDLICTGRLVDAKKAKKIGMVTHCCLDRQMNSMVNYTLEKRPRNIFYLQNYLFKIKFTRRFVAKKILKKMSAKLVKDNYPASFEVLNNWLEYGVSSATFRAEVDSLVELIMTNTSKSLVNLFFLKEQSKKLRSIKFKGTHVHIVGAGVMGCDIAYWVAKNNLQVSLSDISIENLAKAKARIYKNACRFLKAKHEIETLVDRIILDNTGEGLKTADVVIEAASEDLGVKKDILRLIESSAHKDAIIATNTSTIVLEKLNSVLLDKSKLCGIHFFNPVAKMDLVEVVWSVDTNKQLLEKAVGFVQHLKKLPVLVKSCPGFLVNRILLPYMFEAMQLLEEGIPAKIIDKAALHFGMQMGPVMTADIVGLDVCKFALEELGYKSPDRLLELIKSGKLGKKTGQGFYSWARKNPTLDMNNYSGDNTIADRLVLRLVNEAVACWRDGIVDNLDSIDLASVFGFGFAPHFGGIINYIKVVGKDNIIKRLDELKTQHGPRFEKDIGFNDLSL